MLTRRQAEQLEKKTLSSYATHASESQGRIHREPEHPYRTCFQRDHDRIIHSTAFRRLQYKTQVFVIHEGDYYRTRLTHTLEVAQIAGTIARVLRLNNDLVQSLALAHDLGHGPFGHSGEDALQDLMKDHGGFNHNLQALRIVDLLEQRYPSFPGLNLTWEVRQGLNKHRVPVPGFPQARAVNLRLEAQVVDQADELAYDHHDLDDGLTSGLLHEEELNELPVWRQMRKEVRAAFPRLKAPTLRHHVIRRLIDLRVTDLVRESERRIVRYRVRRAADAQAIPELLVRPGPDMKKFCRPLKEFLNKRLYHHTKVARMADKAQGLLCALFKTYLHKPGQLSDTTCSRLKTEDPYRVICDYIAGMTDRYAIQEHRRFSYSRELL